jgi:hypothetical protein
MADTDRFTRLASAIARSTRANFGVGVPEPVISDAERHLGVRFSPSYRWWLSNYGAGYINGHELQGLFPEPVDARDPDLPLVGDVVYCSDANSARPTHRRHLLEILSYEGDEMYYLDTSRPGPDGEHPVVCIYAGSDETRDVAPDFCSFLERELGSR